LERLPSFDASKGLWMNETKAKEVENLGGVGQNLCSTRTTLELHNRIVKQDFDIWLDVSIKNGATARAV
jgi:hypothetical protein